LGHKWDGPKPMVFHDVSTCSARLECTSGRYLEQHAYVGHSDVQTTMIDVHHVPKASAADALSKLVGQES
jgi:hypothetical protein